MARHVTRSELARIAGVSPAAITKACKGPLAPACVSKRIDLDHATVAAYLEKKGVAPTTAPKSAPKRPSKPTERRRRTAEPTARKRPARPPRSRATAPEEPATVTVEPDELEDPERFVDLTLRELTDRFGTETAFKDWLDARKKIADIREKDLKNDETEGRLIARDLVRTHLFGALDAVHRRLLSDSPKTIARLLYAMAKDGKPVEEAEATVRDTVSSHLKKVTTDAARVLRNA